MFLVHDDDLARLDGIWDVTVGRSSIYNAHRDIDVFLHQRPDDSDVMLNHIRNLKPSLYTARIGELFHCGNFLLLTAEALPPERSIVCLQQCQHRCRIRLGSYTFKHF